MTHWKTTFAGISAAILNAYATGAIHGSSWSAVLASIAIAALGYLSADQDKV